MQRVLFSIGFGIGVGLLYLALVQVELLSPRFSSAEEIIQEVVSGHDE